MKDVSKQFMTIVLAATLVWNQPQAWAQSAQNSLDDLKIVVIDGEDGANIVNDQTFTATMVGVQDRNNVPFLVAGISVTFVVAWDATHSGGGIPGTFANGTNTLTVTTDANGRAIMTGFHPQSNGPIQVQAQGSYQGHTVRTATIHQTNFSTVNAATAAGKNVSHLVSSKATNASQASNASKAASAGSGGHGLLIATVVVLGAAGAGLGVAYNQGLLKSGGSNSSTGCSTSQIDSYAITLGQELQTVLTCGTNAGSNSQSCLPQFNTYLTTANQYCSCVGTSNIQTQTLLNTLRNAAGVANVGSFSTTCH